MKAQKRVFIIGGVAAILLIGVTLIMLRQDPIEKKFHELSKDSPVSARDNDALKSIKWKEVDGHAEIEGELSFDQTVALLRKRYDGKLGHPVMQMKMLEELMRYLQKKYPKDWVTVLRDIVYAAFPDLAPKLFRMAENMYKMDKYLADNMNKAGQMKTADRDKMLWDQRYALFGEEADLLWGAEKRMRQMQSYLEQMSSQKSVPVREKFSGYKEQLKNTYGDQLPSVLNNRRQNLMDGFVEAVQDDLAALSPSERSEALTTVRRGLGLDENAVSRWKQLDEERDQRWSNGRLYMSERQTITSQYTGSEREAKLDELRKRLFGEEADSIKNEEASGYLRFSEKQKYGIN